MGYRTSVNGQSHTPSLKGMCKAGKHRLCGGWWCTCDCHEGDLGPIVDPLADHVDHTWEQVGPCVYCCGRRLYNGSVPVTKQARQEVALWWDDLAAEARSEWAWMRSQLPDHNDGPGSGDGTA